MTPCPLNEEDFRIRLILAEHQNTVAAISDPWIREQYVQIRDEVAEECLCILSDGD